MLYRLEIDLDKLSKKATIFSPKVFPVKLTNNLSIAFGNNRIKSTNVLVILTIDLRTGLNFLSLANISVAKFLISSPSSPNSLDLPSIKLESWVIKSPTNPNIVTSKPERNPATFETVSTIILAIGSTYLEIILVTSITNFPITRIIDAKPPSIF